MEEGNDVKWMVVTRLLKLVDVVAPMQRKRCQVDGCDKFAKTGGHCWAHGGGKRCQVEGCDKSARSGGRCIAHGGGKRKRCHVDGCDKFAKTGGR